MSTRTITGNLAADPESQPVGKTTIVKFRVIENTGEYRGGEFTPHADPTTHFCSARFEVGENVAASLKKGDAVIVSGREHTESWGDEGAKQYGRVIDVDAVGALLNRATVVITKNPPRSQKD
ncbi:MAG: single-stranded DNA-binding protein [Microbacteriaceae bacterium]|nr:single-stranded DNA-binding protein [Microbacteriaceae bacterium]